MFRHLVIAACVAIGSSAFANTYTATFQSVQSGELFKLTFDDANPRLAETYVNGIKPGDINWETDKVPNLYSTEEYAAINAGEPGLPPFLAMSWRSTSEPIYVDMDYFGTIAHVLVAGIGYRMDAIALNDFEPSSTNMTIPGWSLDFYNQNRFKTFVATVRTQFSVYAGYLMSTDGPITVQQIYSGGPWFDGIPLQDVQSAFDAQHPSMNTVRQEGMKLLSVTPTVPEPNTMALVLAGALVGAAWTRVRFSLRSTS